MGVDEAGTLAALAAQPSIFDAQVREFDGRVFDDSLKVDEEYDEDKRSSYSSQTGDSKADDPIVIIERP